MKNAISRQVTLGLAGSAPTTTYKNWPLTSEMRAELVASCREPVPQPKWYAEIGAQPNHWMETKAFWLRSAAHYRDPFWRDVHGEMRALRQIRTANRNLIRYCLQVAS